MGKGLEYFSLGTILFTFPLLGEQGKCGLKISHLGNSTVSILW